MNDPAGTTDSSSPASQSGSTGTLHRFAARLWREGLIYRCLLVGLIFGALLELVIGCTWEWLSDDDLDEWFTPVYLAVLIVGSTVLPSRTVGPSDRLQSLRQYSTAETACLVIVLLAVYAFTIGWATDALNDAPWEGALGCAAVGVGSYVVGCAIAYRRRSKGAYIEQAITASELVQPDEIRTALWAYLRVTGKVDSVPALSVLGFIKFYVLFLAWALCFYATVVVLPANGIWWVVAKVRRTDFSLLARPMLRLAAAPFRAAHQGEVPAFNLVVLRPVVRLLVVSHLQHSLRWLRVGIARARATTALIRAPIKPGSDLKADDRIAKQLERTLTARGGFAALAIIPTVVSVVKETATTFGFRIDEGLKSILKALANIQPAAGFAQQLAEHAVTSDYIARLGADLIAWAPYVYFAAPILLTLLLLVSSSFVVKRKLFRSESVYTKEAGAFLHLNEPRKSEVPFDIIALAAAIMTFALLQLTIFATHPTHSEGSLPLVRLRLFVFETVFGCIPYVLLLVYAAIRRYRLRNV